MTRGRALLIPAQAGIWFDMAGPVSRLRGKEQKPIKTTDARVGGYRALRSTPPYIFLSHATEHQPKLEG